MDFYQKGIADFARILLQRPPYFDLPEDLAAHVSSASPHGFTEEATTTLPHSCLVPLAVGTGHRQ